MLAQIPRTFQRLTEEDQARYGEPAMVFLTPPVSRNARCEKKLADWLAWRGASFPAQRHSEYLYAPERDGEAGPKIMISAVMPAPESVAAYLQSLPSENRAKARGNKARNKGYTARRINPAEEAASIHAIVHSASERQGRPISGPLLDRPRDHDFPSYIDYGDEPFNDICCGVFSPPPENILAAYLLGKRVGDHVQYDEIMGHADHVAGDVMYLLHLSFLELCAACAQPPRCLNYGPWYSGVNPFSPEGGLNRWKRKVNFKPGYLILASC